jgi:Uma2 family endonuclease
MTVPKRDTLRHTYADYLAWSRSSGDELIDGVAYVKEPPAPSPIHQGIVAELCRQAGNALEDTLSRVFVAPFDVRLPKSNEQGDEVDTVVQPDVLIICDRLKTDSRGIRGAPDWIAEVLSPSTASYDQIVKLPAYERAGVGEVWLIHPIDALSRFTVWKKAATGGPPFLSSKATHKSAPFRPSPLTGTA